MSECMDYVNSAHNVLSVYAGFASITKGFAEFSIPYAPAAKAINAKLAPLQIIGVLRAPLETFMMGRDFVDLFKAPKYLKLLPFLSMVETSGNLLDYFTTGVWVAEQMGAEGIEALTTACTPIGMAAFGLQSVAVLITAWKTYEVFKVYSKVKEELGDAPLAADYNNAVNLMTQAPTSKFRTYRERFFGVFGEDQKAQIVNIWNKAAGEADAAVRMAPAFETIKGHIIQKLAQNAISLALVIIGMVGVGLLTFAAVSMAPIAAGIIAGVSLAGLALLCYGIHEEASFNEALLQHVN